MKDVTTKAVITGPDGFYYREEHEWRGLNQLASDWFAESEKKLTKFFAKATSDKHEGQLTATLDYTHDGKVEPTLVITGVTHQELHEVQVMWHQMSGEIIHAGATHARNKAKHGK